MGRNLRESRVTTTRVLAEAIARIEPKPAFLAGNGIAIYGDHGAEPLTEAADTRGHALLTEVTRDWEAAAQPAARAGARVCVLRTAPVMDRRSAAARGACAGCSGSASGGRLGDGRQYFPMISLRDWVGAVVHLAEHDDASGPFNLCCPRDADQRRVHPGARPRGRPSGVRRRAVARDPARRRPDGAGAARLDQPRAPGAARRAASSSATATSTAVIASGLSGLR